MLTRSKIFLALALTLALAAATASTAQAGRGMEIAVQDDAVLLGAYGDAKIALDLAEGLQTSRIRLNVTWSYAVGSARKKKKAPKHIKYNWSGYDLVTQVAGSRGIKVQLALAGPAPAWATANHKVGPVKPKASAFAAFAKAAATHFKGRVDRYSIWNEPNHRSWISPIKSQGKVYRALYLAGYKAIKKADPGAKVFIGETSPFKLGRGKHVNAQSPLKFLRAVTCANKRYKRAKKCGTLKTDGYAHHPYDFDHKPTYRYPGKDNVTIGVLGRLTSALSKLRKAKLLTTPSGGVPFIYLTEYGYFSSGRRKVSASRHAKYLVQAFTIAQKNRRVKQMLHFLLVEPTKGYKFFDTSIASRSGKKSKAFNALAKWAKRAAAAGGIAVAARPSGGGNSETAPSSGGGSTGSPPSEQQPPPNCTVVAGIPVCS